MPRSRTAARQAPMGLESCVRSVGLPTLQRVSTPVRQDRGDAAAGTRLHLPNIYHLTVSRQSPFRRPSAPRSFGSAGAASGGLSSSVTAFGRAFNAYSNPALALMRLPLLVTQLPMECHPHRTHQDFPS